MPIIKHIAFLTIIWILLPEHPQVQVTREYQLKAVFLYNFCQFVDWPADAFKKSDDPLVIGVIGSNPFGTYLEETIRGEKIGTHPVLVHYYKDAEDVSVCHLLFIAINDSQESSTVITSLKGKSILTISDQPGFLKQQGMIRFMSQQNKIRFEINVEATKSAGLALSSKLLRLADIYVPSKN